jgi:hypothetical protein
MAGRAEKLNEMFWAVLALLLGMWSTLWWIFWHFIFLVCRRIKIERNTIMAHRKHNMSLVLWVKFVDNHDLTFLLSREFHSLFSRCILFWALAKYCCVEPGGF